MMKRLGETLPGALRALANEIEERAGAASSCEERLRPQCDHSQGVIGHDREEERNRGGHGNHPEI